MMQSRSNSALRVGLLLIACILLFSLSCTKESPSEQVPQLSTELNIYCWWNNLDPITVANFEKEFGVKVNVDTYEDDEIMLSVIQSDATKYDLVFPTDSLVSEMIQMKLLAPLDLRYIPNLANIGAQYLDLPYDPNNAYSVPYLWGTTGITVNTNHVTDEVNSWAVLWDSRYSGRIGMMNNPHTVIGLTLKQLGYSLNSAEASQLEESRIKLMEQTRLLNGYLNPMEYTEKIKAGEIWLAQTYNGDGVRLREENPEIDFVIPDEGSDYYMRCMSIPRDAPHKYTAEVFIDYVLAPDVHARIAEYTCYACPNRTAADSGLIDPDFLRDPLVTLPPRTQIRIEAHDLSPHPDESKINEIWAELKRQ